MSTKVNGWHCKVMIDNGATNNFITPECARKFGLRTDSTVEIPINFVQGSTSSGQLARNVLVEAGAWKGFVSFLIVDMQEYEAIFGLEWMDQYLISFFGKRSDKVLLDNLDDSGGVLVDLF